MNFEVILEGMALPPPKIGRRVVFRGPPEWNEYIPKKNRHSESVSDKWWGKRMGVTQAGRVVVSSFPVQYKQHGDRLSTLGEGEGGVGGGKKTGFKN